MYQRPSQNKIATYYETYKKDRLFQNLYQAMECVTPHILFTPEEIWTIALSFTTEIAHSGKNVFVVDTLPNRLERLLSEYKNEDSAVIYHLEPDILSNTCFFVQLTILYQLTRYQKEWKNHPYQPYCLGVLREIEHHPLFEKTLPIITQSNNRYEEVYGSEVDSYDYIPSVVKENEIIKEAIELTIACEKYLTRGYDLNWLKRFWCELVEAFPHIKDKLQTKEKYTTIYHIIGMLRRNDVFNASDSDLGATYFTNNDTPNPDSARRYVGKGRSDNATPIAKFVIQYVENDKNQKMNVLTNSK